ncbi:MAG: TonB-dependent receptor [Chitinophagaceae bacterium]|nr:TonB-dependent receptor [Chitinophagaceae bacterium]
MVKFSVPKLIFLCAVAMCGMQIAEAQYIQNESKIYDSLSLKDLLNVKIVSISKAPEFLFDAPLSGSVITKEDIRRAGSTSIMEALRLVPGVIIREQSNGNYDIHIRGMDNVPPDAPFEITSNTTTLVMIDNRPTYSYLRGGTFWETIPVDLNDVEKIEVVRGPAAALYGPNAVNGVINIITRQFKKAGLHAVLNSQAGSNQTQIANGSLSYTLDRVSVIASGNYTHRNRSQTSYFEYVRNEWLENPQYFVSFDYDTVRNIDNLYPDRNLAMEKYAGNLFVTYEPRDRMLIQFSGGLQHSTVQKILSETGYTPFSTNVSDSRYGDVKIAIKGLNAQLSYSGGTQLKNLQAGNKYDFQTVDANVEYNFTKNNFSIKPGISYRSAIYDDTKYSDTVNKTGVFNSRGEITTKSAFVRGEYKMLDGKLRLVAGLTANKFNYPDTTYLSYQFAATYKFNAKHIIRFVVSKAPRSSNIYDTYVDQTFSVVPVGPNRYARRELIGNKNLKLLTSSMIEIGYRARLSSDLNLDIEVFRTKMKNVTAFVQDRIYAYASGPDSIYVAPVIAMNLPLELYQTGITLSVSYAKKNIQIKPFVTFQHTKIQDYAPYATTPDAYPGLPNIYSGIGTETRLKSTPAFYGGFSANYMPTAKWNINLNAYSYSTQVYTHVTNIVFNDGIRGIDHIKSKTILNLRVAYEPVKGLNLFLNGKNLLNDKTREFFKADDMPFSLLGGISYEL